jgi:hypothetical protein
MKKLSPLLFTATALAITLLACRKIQPDFDVSAEDPCDCASEVSADFDIIEPISHQLPPEQNVFTLTDDILTYKRAYFRAKVEDAEYTWYIGIDTLNDREVNRFFQEQWGGSNIPITLVVKKEPNYRCFPNDDGYDSITKIMRVHNYCDTNILEGTFRIAEENSLDSFDIVLDIRGRFTNNIFDPSDCRAYDFYNYDRQGANCIMNIPVSISRNYRFFRSRVAADLSCGKLAVFHCSIDLNNVFSINYYYDDQNGNRQVNYCLGRKL